MTADTELHTHPGASVEPHHRTHEHTHPSDRQYVIIAAILAVITAAEVSTYFMEDPDIAVLAAILFPMMIVKFAVVCAYFMHLKYDNPIFRRVFVFGLVLAVAVFLIALTSLQFWS
jgi:cytochrome c oxidase subunit IV